MTNVWRGSWGTSWGNSWRASAQAAEQPVQSPNRDGFGGGAVAHTRRKRSASARAPRRLPDLTRTFTVQINEDGTVVRPAPKLVHEVIAFAAAEPIRVGSKPLAVIESHAFVIGGAAHAGAFSRGVEFHEHTLVALEGVGAIVEIDSGSIEVEYRNPWQTVRADNEAVTAENSKLKAELAKATRNREAMELMLLAA